MSEIVVAYPIGNQQAETMADAAALAEAAAARLRQAPYLELRQVACAWHDGVLQLQGHVSSYYLRQIAQTLVQGLEGVEAIDNQLEVIPGRLPKNRRL
jgi:osmotically-inducible protein OsmY